MRRSAQSSTRMDVDVIVAEKICGGATPITSHLTTREVFVRGETGFVTVTGVSMGIAAIFCVPGKRRADMRCCFSRATMDNRAAMAIGFLPIRKIMREITRGEILKETGIYQLIFKRDKKYGDISLEHGFFLS